MSNPNRVKVYFLFWCGRCRTETIAGSGAVYCKQCYGLLKRISKTPQTKIALAK